METELAVDALAALAQPTRLEIFRRLVQAGPAGATPGELAALLDVPPSTLSFHLKELRGAGLVVRRREARSLRYAADFPRMGELLGFLTEQCCRGLALAGDPRAEACSPCAPRAPRKETSSCDSSSP